MKRIGTLNGKTIVETSDLNTLKDNEVAIRYDGDKLTLLERSDNGDIVEISGRDKEVITILQEDLDKSGHPEEFSEGIQKLIPFFNSIPNGTTYSIDEIIDKAPLILLKGNSTKYYISNLDNLNNVINAAFIQYFNSVDCYSMIKFELKINTNTLTTQLADI